MNFYNGVMLNYNRNIIEKLSNKVITHQKEVTKTSSDISEKKETVLPGYSQSGSAIAAVNIVTAKTIEKVKEQENKKLNNSQNEPEVQMFSNQFLSECLGSFCIDELPLVGKFPKQLLLEAKEYHKTPDRKGSLPIHHANAKTMHEIHLLFRDEPEVLKEIHTKHNLKGRLPIHYANAEKMQEIFSVFKDDPEFLKELLTTPDCKGIMPINQVDTETKRIIENFKETENKEISKKNESSDSLASALEFYTTAGSKGKLPIHNANAETMREFHELFKDIPRVLEKVHTTEDSKGRLPIHYANAETMREIFSVFNDNPKFLKKLLTTPDSKGRLPIHFANAETMREIFSKFKDDKNGFLEQLIKTRDSIGRRPYSYVDSAAKNMIVEYSLKECNSLDYD